MRPQFNQSQRQELSTGLRVDPRVVLSSQLLQLAQPELEMAIEAELNENPALERLQDDVEPLTNEAILRTLAPRELNPTSEDYEFKRSIPDDAQTDWLDLAASHTTLWDHLRAQLLPDLPKSLQRLGEYLIESISEKGYLTSPIEEIALSTDETIENVEMALKKLQECEPQGIGARDLQECLLIQLRGGNSLERKLARAIVKSHLQEFIARDTKRLMRRYKVLPDVIDAAFAEILALTPYPGESFLGSARMQATAKSVSVQPDLVICRTEAGWQIEVRGADPGSLKVNSFYRKRHEELGKMKNAPKDEARHVGVYVDRATHFLQSLQQRRRTLRRIGEYLIQHQASFVATGDYTFLQALTRSQLASDLEMHESTVSRATMSKFVQIANGEVVPFEVFFKPALRVQKMIEEILMHENPNNPFSDERIAQMLAEKGIHVARRTVNKYRDKTKLLSSRKRRSA